MTTLMSLQPWSWQILILIQLRWQYFQIFCLWRRSLCLNLVLTLKNCNEPPSYASNASTAYVVAIWPSFLFESLETNLGNWWDFFGQMVYRPPSPPWQKISRTPMPVLPCLPSVFFLAWMLYYWRHFPDIAFDFQIRSTLAVAAYGILAVNEW